MYFLSGGGAECRHNVHIGEPHADSEQSADDQRHQREMRPGKEFSTVKRQKHERQHNDYSFGLTQKQRRQHPEC